MTQFSPGRFQVLPVIIKNLIIINAIVFLAQLTFDGMAPQSDMAVENGFVTDTFALHQFYSPLFRPWQLFTHMFMHGSFMHLFFNMFGLWLFGSVLEDVWTPRRFLVFYLACGFGAALFHLGTLWWENHQLMADLEAFVQHPTLQAYQAYYSKYNLSSGGYDYAFFDRLLTVWQNDPTNLQFAEQAVAFLQAHAAGSINTPTVGASGAVFGCLAAFGYLFPNHYVYLYFLVPMRVKWFVLVYLGVELVLALRNSAGDNVARWAHLGGALVGFLLVFFRNKTDRRSFY